MSAPETCSVVEIGSPRTEARLFTFLKSITSTSPTASLPRDVIDDVNPYLHEPWNLPEGIWYVVDSKDPKQAEEVGSWKIKGDPCQIYSDSDSSTTGWRITLEFYRAPQGIRTDWVMQVYSISDKGSIEAKGGSSLCRVFQSDIQGESKKPDQPQANDGVKSPMNKPLENEIHVNVNVNVNVNVMLPYQGENLLHADYFSEGDFLELDDLDDPQTSSSSSGNSSCIDTPSSEVYFDPNAFLQELGTNLSSNKFTSTRPNDMVLTVAPQGSAIGGDSSTAASEAALALESKQPEKKHNAEDTKAEPPPALHDAGPSTSRQTPRGSKGKMVYRGNSIKKFFCFMAF